MSAKKYSIILGNLGNTCDRFLSGGYKETLDKDVMIAQAARIEGVTGIELVGAWDIDEQTAPAMKRKLANAGLACASIIPDLFSRKKWGSGSLSSVNPAIRKDAVAEIKTMIDIAAEIGCGLINLWPGQDGYDYPLATNYIRAREWLMAGIRECARYAGKKKIKIALEFKVKEPRTHSYLARTADTLLVARELGLDNLGVCIDTGHAFMGYENVGESIAILKMCGARLFHMHFNDNHSLWDDDLIVGSVRLVEYFELLFWLEKTGYRGWLSMDQYPYREDGYGAIRASVLFVRRLQGLLDSIGRARVEDLINRHDPVATAGFIRANLIAMPKHAYRKKK